MSKVSFVARWGIVFSILGFFTLYSLAAFSVGHQNKAYADAISSSNLRDSKNFVVMDDDEDDHGGGHGPFHHKTRMICAINQNQLNALRDAFSTAVFTTTEVGGQPKGIVDVDRTPGVTKHAVYQTIHLNPNACQIIQAPQEFLLFLLPGVS